MGNSRLGRRKGYNGTLLERFERLYIPEPNSGCWLWLGSLAGEGRATIRLDKKMINGSRASWLLFKNHIPLPKNIHILHTCDMPSCVNPDHLWLGSHADNMRDCEKKGRRFHLFGEGHSLAKLTEADVLEIRTGALSSEGYAQKFGVHLRTIFKAKSGETWKHLA
jgi:hypothetical protein